jgi:cell division protein FtsQ
LGRNRRRVDRAAQTASSGTRVRVAARLLAAAALLALAVPAGRAAWRYATTGAALRIGEIRIHGQRNAGPEELLALSPVKRGDNWLTADTAAVEQALARHPWVESAGVRRSWPPSLEVTIREREAAALVDLGGLYLVDREAHVFKRAAPGDGLDLPVITGFTRDDYVQRRGDVDPLLADALRLAESWAAAGLDRSLPLAEIHLDGLDGITVYAGEEGIQVRLGGGDVAPKLARLQTVLAALAADGRGAEVIHLDNRAHPSWVTVRVAESGGAPRVSPRRNTSPGAGG